MELIVSSKTSAIRTHDTGKLPKKKQITYKILLNKLEFYGNDGKFKTLIKSYPKDDIKK